MQRLVLCPSSLLCGPSWVQGCVSEQPSWANVWVGWWALCGCSCVLSSDVCEQNRCVAGATSFILRTFEEQWCYFSPDICCHSGLESVWLVGERVWSHVSGVELLTRFGRAFGVLLLAMNLENWRARALLRLSSTAPTSSQQVWGKFRVVPLQTKGCARSK